MLENFIFIIFNVLWRVEMFEEVLESLVLTMCAMKGKRIFHGQLTLETDNGRKLLEFKFGGESILLSREKTL